MTTVPTTGEVVQSNPRFWTAARSKLLETVLKNTTDYKFETRNLEAVENDLRGTRPKLSRQMKKRLAAILEELNTVGLLDAVVPEIPIRIPQPSILPADIASYTHLDTMLAIMDFLKNDWLSKHCTMENLALGFAMTLSADAGLPKDTVINALVQLRYQDIQNDGTLSLAIHPKDNTARRSYVEIPTSSRNILRQVKQRTNKIAQDNFLFVPDVQGLKQRKKKLLKILKSAYSTLITASLCSAPSLTMFLSLGPLIAFHRGLEPFLITAFKGPALPTSHPFDSPLSLIRTTSSPPSGLINYRMTSCPVTGFPTRTIPPKIEKDETENIATPIDDWSGRSKLILRKLIHTLKSNWESHLPKGQIDSARSHFSEARTDANNLTDRKSALHLALDWAEYKFVEERAVTPSTVETYLERTFLTGFLTDPESFDLDEWDAEDHELLLEASLSRDRLQPNTRKEIASTFSQVYRYAESHGYCPNVDIKFIADEWIGGTHRNEILGLGEFDAFLRILVQQGTRDSLMYAVIAILGFYGGLRAAEVTRLSINDIIIDDDYLAVEIQWGKTPAARRRILVSSFAPPEIWALIRDLVAQRRNEFGSDAVLKSISLFGPEGNRNRYEGRQLIDQVIRLLKNWFGQDTVFHTLRHCFASWLVVRWYALRHPTVLDDLRESHHAIFNNSMQKRLTYLFTLGKYDTIPNFLPHDLVTITKIMGHASPKIFFQHYVHTLYILQRHAVTITLK